MAWPPGTGSEDGTEEWVAPPDEDGACDWPPSCLDFCEEPLRPDALFELPAMYLNDALPYALDESVTPLASLLCAAAGPSEDSGVGSKVAVLRARLAAPGCCGLVLKPTLLGGAEVSRRLASEAESLGVPVVLTSAFESGVAHAHIALLASVTGGPSTAHGLSTYERLQQDALSPPFAAAVTGGDLIDVAAAQAALDATADALAKG